MFLFNRPAVSCCAIRSAVAPLLITSRANGGPRYATIHKMCLWYWWAPSWIYAFRTQRNLLPHTRVDDCARKYMPTIWWSARQKRSFTCNRCSRKLCVRWSENQDLSLPLAEYCNLLLYYDLCLILLSYAIVFYACIIV